MPDIFARQSSSLISPMDNLASVTPHNTNELGTCSRAIYVGISGDVKLTTVDGDVVTLKNVIAGCFHPVRARIIWATGTTGADIVVGW